MNSNDFPNYSKLFGDINFREADEARSVYSPAAYLADLLQLIDDQFVDTSIDLDQRRQDIKKIRLDSENTFTLLPYLDIVNEVLEKKVENSVGRGQEDAYEILRLADYPLNLPFNRDRDRIALYEKYLGVTPEEFHKAFAQPYNPDVVAQEYLGLSEEDVAIITKPAEENLETRYGDRLPDLGTPPSIPVSEFLAITGLTHWELKELLVGNLDARELEEQRQSIFFCNANSAVFAKYDAAEANIVWASKTKNSEENLSSDLAKQWLDRAQRLIRLSRITDLTIVDLDLIIRNCCDNTLNSASLQRIAIIKHLSTTFDLKVDETCALFSAMSDVGHGTEDRAADLFHRVFNGSFASLAKTYVGKSSHIPIQLDGFKELTYSGDILKLDNKPYRDRIAQSLKISEKQLQVAIRGFRSRANEDIEDEDLFDSLWTSPDEEISMLSTLYRVSKLATVLDTSFEDLFILLDILERDQAARQFANSDVFIDYTIAERNSYTILLQGSTQELLWLVQILHSLMRWLTKHGLTAEELLKISTGRYRRYLKDVTDLSQQQKLDIESITRKEKIVLLNTLYSQLKPWLLNQFSFVDNIFDQRFARVVYEAIAQSTLVAEADRRLVRFHEETLMAAAHETISRIDQLTQADFRGLGLEEKIADKIFANLILMGYLTTTGRLNEMMMPESPSNLILETDFTYLQETLFEAIQALHEEYVDVAIYPSDLDAKLASLDLSKAQLDELYDNLIFNGFLSEEGTLQQGATFSSIENLDLFEVNSGIGEYASDVYALLHTAIERFKQTEVVITQDVFADLPLTETEVSDLVENLRFNEYIDEKNVLLNHALLLQITAEDLLLELRFYPHRHKILTAIQAHIERHKDELYIFKKEQFFDIADQLVADWAFEAIGSQYLQAGYITEQHRDYFRDLENASTLDIAWPFEPNHNRVVFERIRSIIQTADKYCLTNTPFELFKFDESEINELIDILIDTGYLTDDRKIPSDQISYFLNINNALEFVVQAFEDYNKDVFFMLHAIAKQVDQTTQAIATLYQGLIDGQKNALYQPLQEAFGLPSDSIVAIFKQVFGEATNVQEEWFLPILQTVNIHDRIEQEPDSSRFNTAYRRIQQFALLAAKLKLDQDEIEIAFHDQNLAEKYPESIELPAVTTADGHREAITSFDALLESKDGRIYLFKSADITHDSARYWVYSAITHELIETEDNNLSTLLTGNQTTTVNLMQVNAAFVDKQGRDVLIVDGQYYVKVPAKDDSVWQIHEREWGRVDSDFENLPVIDGAFTDESGRTYLFANDQYVRYSNGIEVDARGPYVDDGYPKDIANDWQTEGKNHTLSEEFQVSLDAAFHGADNKTYFFKDDQFLRADDPEFVQSTRDVWGQVKNTLKTSQRVDAFYGDGSQYFVLSGDQIFAYRDSLETEGVMVQEGFPKPLTEHFGPSLPGEFYAGVDAAFKGEDGLIYLFKGEKSVGINLADAAQTTQVVDTQARWGIINNALTTHGQVDAALAGLDGRVYVFSGDQYFRYSNSDYAEVDSGYPRAVSNDWGGLTAIHAAFVRDGKTYLFGTGEVEQADGTKDLKAAYVRYSTNDYEKPDDGYPKEQKETDNVWWNLPESIQNYQDFEAVNAVFNAPDGKTFLFSGNVFVYFDRGRSWWSEPMAIRTMWKDIPFDAIDAAFTGKDGKTYFFSGSEYVRFAGDDYCQLDNGYPRPTNRLWGHVKNNIAERGLVEAALVVESREQKEAEDGTLTTLKTLHTYLFSGDQFFRYKDADYTHVEPGYPKALSLLKDEPRFNNLDVTLTESIDGAFSDRRNVFLLQGKTLHVVSEEPCAKYLGSDDTAFENVGCAFIDQGAVYLEKDDPEASGWHHISSLEGRDSRLADSRLTLTLEMPPLLTAEDIPDDYKARLDAVLQGTDTNTYLFKGGEFFNQGLNREFAIAEHWGRRRNTIRDRNAIDAGFVGRDGKTYVFSGNQYVVYEGATYIGQTVFQDSEQQPAIRAIADDWGGLTSVHVAYVMGNHTYLFEEPDAFGNFRYVRYSSTDYEHPDSGFPRIADADFWQIPPEYQTQGWDTFDAVEFENDDTLLFIKGREFLQFNINSGHWFRPKALDMLWESPHPDDDLFDNLQAAFMGADGTAYFFGDECYITHKEGAFTERRRIGDDWGILPTPFDRIDAAFVYRNTVTYLFAGKQYTRYSGTDYCNMDDGYPKWIAQDLRQEPGFENLPPDFEVRAGAFATGTDTPIIDAVVASDRHIYVFMGNDCYISSSHETDTYTIDRLGQQRNQLVATGEVDAAFVQAGKTYLFAGDQYVRYSGSNYDYVDAGYPKRIATGLAADLKLVSAPDPANPSTPAAEPTPIPATFHTDIDAALSAADGTVYLFKADQFLNAQTGEVKPVKDTWGKTQNNFTATSGNAAPIDGAFVDAMGRLYAFKGDQFIRYADTDQTHVETGYPQAIASTFQTLPDIFHPITEASQREDEDASEKGIDGAFTFEGRTYLVKGEHYVRYTGDDYGCLPSFYPVTFKERWGDWSDYRLRDIQIIARFKFLQDSYSGEQSLVDLLQGYVKHPYALLANIFDWDIEAVKWLKRHNAFLPPNTEDETQFNLELICRMFDILTLTHKMATDAKSAYEAIWQQRYGANPNLAIAADALMERLAMKHGNNPDWQVLLDEIHNKLNVLKRDALVPYAIFRDAAIADTRDLYEQLLIDTQMGESAQVSRIKEAISAIQLYFHRYFINLEDIELKDANQGIQKAVLKDRWQWMRNYRVWEANRKVFLYPENTLRPELRNTKTPEFKALEENLLQGELTEENITQAFNRYIDRYIEISRLTIAGGYVYDGIENSDDKHIILFGRTKNEPHQYYYRMATFVEGQSDAVNWQPWLEVNVQIDANRVYPVYALNKIFVFWAKVETRSSVGTDTKLRLKGDPATGFESETDAVHESVLQVYYSYFNLNREWAPPQKINYDITSNDTIVDFFLEFNGMKEKVNTDLDNIQVSCHYTTERQIRPKLDGNGVLLKTADVAKYFTEKPIELASNNGKVPTDSPKDKPAEGETTSTDSPNHEGIEIKISLKASNARKPYYLDSWKSHQPDGQVDIKFIPPGTSLGKGMKFRVVAAPSSPEAPARIAFESVAKPKHYLYCDTTTGDVRLQELQALTDTDSTAVQASLFLIAKGRKGDGYSLKPASFATALLSYPANGTSEMVVQRTEQADLETSPDPLQATFSFITRKEEDNTFRFYPETYTANKVPQDPSAALKVGINKFKELFPQEDITQIGQPVLLSVPVDQQSLPWVCFDYKGGSFLCKPTSGQTEISTQGNLKDLVDLTQFPDGFTPVAAAFQVNDRTYLFSENSGQDNRYLMEGYGEAKTTDAWGVVNNAIQAEGQIDAALVRAGKTFLFRGDQYVVYTHTAEGGYDRYVDESYPRLLTGNTDALPDVATWDRIDAAFQAGDTSYFLRGDEYVTSTDLKNPQPLANLWPQATLADICGVFEKDTVTYAFDEHRNVLFKEDSESDLQNRLNRLYKPTKASEIPLADVTAAFAIGKFVYLKVENSSVRYMRYEGGVASSVFKHLNAAQKMKAVFVEGKHFYILKDPEDGVNPIILRWDIDASVEPQSIEIEITDAPDRDVDSIFYDSQTQKTYLLSLRQDEYMVMDGLPGSRSGPIAWQKAGNIDDYAASLKTANLVTKIDAGFNKDGKVFLISGGQYSRFSDPTLAAFDPGYPQSFKEAGDRDGLPSWDGIDAAFQQETRSGGHVWFFRGQEYSTDGTRSDRPRESSNLIKDQWGKVRNNIQRIGRVDAAFTLDDRVYLVSGDQYYRYAAADLTGPPPEGGYPLAPGYPKRLANNTDGFPDWIDQDWTESGTLFERDGKIVGVVYDYSRLGEAIYLEFDPQTGTGTQGGVTQQWQLPENFRRFDAAYYNKTDHYLYLIAGETYLKYQQPTYDIIRLSSMTGSQLSQTLFVDGINGLMRRPNQEIDELPRFTLNPDRPQGSTEDAIIRVAPDKVSHIHLPVNSHLEFRGANGVYYWELFYHAPTLIAQSLNTAQKFEAAKRWYEYIFDPTAGSDYWNFLPFRAVDIETLIAAIAPWENNDATASAATNLIAKLRPFAPALLGQASLAQDEAEFNRLGQWDDQGHFTTWAEVTQLESQLTALADAASLLEKKAIAVTQEVIELIKRLPIRYALMTSTGPEQINAYLDDPADPHAIASLRRIAYRRSTVMAYIDNLLDWGDLLFRQYTQESINEARMLYILAYDLLGKKPSSLGTQVLSLEVNYQALQAQGAEAIANAYDFLFDVADDDQRAKSLTHAGIVHESVGNPYFYVPENRQILGYWDRIEDNLYKIRQSLNILGVKQPLPLFQPPIDPMALVRAVAGGGGISAVMASQRVAVPHYRFTFMLNKARELAGKLSQFGNELLGTIEKKDAEELSILQSRQEGIILQMTRTIREAQLREAEANLKSLEISKASVEDQRAHYEALLNEGLIAAEKVQIGMMTAASIMFLLIPALQLGAAVVNAIPDVKVGAPTTIGAETGGSLLGASLGFIAESAESIAEGISMGGEVAGIYAQYERTLQDWRLQKQMAEREIAQLEAQIEGAKWQIQGAEQELAVHDKEIAHNESITTFMQAKFSNQQLYQWMMSKLSALYFQTYKMAHDMAKSAERAYCFERGVPESQVNFIGGSYWDSLRQGILAGESLDFDLDRLEKAYLEMHTRDFEITKTISLVELDPMAYLDLKRKGVCEFQFTEALFDYDFPGHYGRQIKTIALKLDAGKGKTVNATLTQLRHKTVLEPDAKAVKFLLDPKDSQPLSIRSDWRPNQQIAVSEVDPYSETSNGLFELNFGDERYLPFEGTGAVSSWRLELGGKRGSYDVNALVDVAIELKYTARPGGEVFADAVKGMLKPYDTAVYFDIAQMFPNEFFAFVYGETEDLEITVTREMFPNMAGTKLTGIYSVFEMAEDATVTLVMNEDEALTLRDNALLLVDSLGVKRAGERWRFEAKGDKSKLVNMRLVLSYKASISE